MHQAFGVSTRALADMNPINRLMEFIDRLVPYLILHESQDWDAVNRGQWIRSFS